MDLAVSRDPQTQEIVLPGDIEFDDDNDRTYLTLDVSDSAIYNPTTYHVKQNNNTLQYDQETQNYYLQQEFEYPAKKIKLTNIDTSIIPSGGDPPITIDNAVITDNGQYLPSDFDPTTGDLMPIDPTTGERTQSNAEYFTSVEVDTNPLPLDPNQPPLTSNGQYTIYDKDEDDDMDIVESNHQPQQRKLIMTRDVIDDQSYRNIGTFTVNVPSVQSKIELEGIKFTSSASGSGYPFSIFNVQSTLGNVSVNNSETLIVLENFGNYYRFRIIKNSSGSTVNFSVGANSLYYKNTTSVNNVYIYDSNDNLVFDFYDNDNTDENGVTLFVYKTYFNISTFN